MADITASERFAALESLAAEGLASPRDAAAFVKMAVRGRETLVSLDSQRSCGELTYREAAYCWLRALHMVSPKVGGYTRCMRDCGYSRADIGKLEQSPLIKATIRQFRNELISDGLDIPTVRQLALERLSAAATSDISALIDYAPRHIPIVPHRSINNDSRLNCGSENNGEVQEGGGGYPQNRGGGLAGEGPTHTANSNFQPESSDTRTPGSDFCPESSDAHAGGSGSLPDVLGSGNYAGYIMTANGDRLRIRTLDELPLSVTAGIKSFKMRNEGTRENPLFVPEIEFYDGIRASELLLKYTGDIGTGRGDREILMSYDDIVGLIDGARARSIQLSGVKKMVKTAKVIDVEFEESELVHESGILENMDGSVEVVAEGMPEHESGGEEEYEGEEMSEREMWNGEECEVDWG